MFVSLRFRLKRALLERHRRLPAGRKKVHGDGGFVPWTLSVDPRERENQPLILQNFPIRSALPELVTGVGA
jgi:hypothetical protein